ncbi:MAG: YesL family protein [Clostridiales bacterium]|nr:YesL family protein [Candidatus Blautia equi]
MDNIFFRTIGKIVDIFWINILTLICSLPVVTAGAAITAMFYNLVRMADNDEGALTRGFFRVFKENFKKATKIWLVILLLLIVFGGNLFLVRIGIMDGYGALETASMAVLCVLLGIILMVSVYIFVLLGRYENTAMKTVKNAALLAVAYLPKSLCMLVILFFPVALMTLSNYFLYFWFAYGLAFPAYFISMLMVPILRETEPKEEESHELENI